MEKCSKKIIFADLDGTLIDTNNSVTSPFPRGIWDMSLKLYVWDAIKKLQPQIVCIVTNQGGIEKGFVNEENFVKGKMAYVCRALAEYCGCECTFKYCKSNDKGNMDRKPNVGMLESFSREYFFNEKVSDLKKKMLMIGDASGLEGQFSDSDKKTAENFGIDYMDVWEFVLNVSDYPKND